MGKAKVLTLEDLRKAKAFPKEFLNCLAENKCVCGADHYITETLSMIYCSNPFCLEKMVDRQVSMLVDLGIKNMGASKCKSFLSDNGITNPYAIFAYDPDEDGPLYEGCSMKFSKAMFDQIDEKRSMTLADYIAIGNLPGIQTKAKKLVQGFDDLNVFYEELETEGIMFVQNQLGIKGKRVDDIEDFFTDDVLEMAGVDLDELAYEDAVSISAIQIYVTLMIYKNQLLECLDYIDIIEVVSEDEPLPVVSICISTSVGEPFENKKDFVRYLTKEFRDCVQINYIKSVTKECDILIWSGKGAKTGKVLAAEEKISKYLRAKEEGDTKGIKEIKIMNAIDGIKYLERYKK